MQKLAAKELEETKILAIYLCKHSEHYPFNGKFRNTDYRNWKKLFIKILSKVYQKKTVNKYCYTVRLVNCFTF